MLYVIEQAVRMYKENRITFNRLATRAMQGQYGWDRSAQAYLELYKKALGETEPAEAEE